MMLIRMQGRWGGREDHDSGSTLLPGSKMHVPKRPVGGQGMCVVGWQAEQARRVVRGAGDGAATITRWMYPAPSAARQPRANTTVHTCRAAVTTFDASQTGSGRPAIPRCNLRKVGGVLLHDVTYRGSYAAHRSSTPKSKDGWFLVTCYNNVVVSALEFYCSSVKAAGQSARGAVRFESSINQVDAASLTFSASVGCLEADRDGSINTRSLYLARQPWLLHLVSLPPCIAEPSSTSLVILKSGQAAPCRQSCLLLLLGASRRTANVQVGVSVVYSVRPSSGIGPSEWYTTERGTFHKPFNSR